MALKIQIFKKITCSLCVGAFCLQICLHTVYMSGAWGNQKRLADLLKLELQMVVSHPVDAGYRTQLFGMSSSQKLILIHENTGVLAPKAIWKCLQMCFSKNVRTESRRMQWVLQCDGELKEDGFMLSHSQWVMRTANEQEPGLFTYTNKMKYFICRI